MALPDANLSTLSFHVTQIGRGPRRVAPEWFAEFGSCLEYSETKDRA